MKKKKSRQTLLFVFKSLPFSATSAVPVAPLRVEEAVTHY